MPPPFSPLDAAQCVRGAFDDATGRFRTDATAVIIGGDVTVEVDGIYTPLNPDPDNIGIIGHIRAASPTDPDQINRITSITNLDVHALDVSIHNSDGSDISSSSPLNVLITNASIPVTQSGIWSVGRTWTLDSTTDSITSFQGGLWDVSVNNFPATQPISGTVTALQGTTPWIVSGTVAATQSGAWTVTSLQGTSPWVVSATDLDIRDLVHTQDSVRLGNGTTFITSTTVGPSVGLDVNILNTIPISGSITVTNFPTTVDTNYGVVGASTIRTASQIGNATGAAAFGAGTTTAQVLRVVLPTDQTSIPVTQSGTWNINNISGTISLPTGAATETTLAKLPLTQGSTTAGQSGVLAQGSVTTNSPSYTNGQTSPLSLSTLGALRVEEPTRSENTINNQTINTTPSIFPSNLDVGQAKEVTFVYRVNGPVTGTSPSMILTIQDIDGFGNVTGNQTATPAITGAIVDQILTHTTRTGKLQIVATLTGTTPSFGGVSAYLTSLNGSFTIRDSAGTELATSANPLRVDPTGTTPQPASQSGTWNINNISGTISLPTGAATSANQTTQITSLQLLDDVPAANNAAFNKGNPIMGQLDDVSTVVATEDNVSVARITAQRALHTNLRNTAGTEIATSANPLRTDPTGTTTQPVSGTVAATQSGAWTTGRTWTLASGTDSVTNNMSQVGGASVTLGQKTSANSIPVVIASDQSTISVTSTPGTATVSTYSGATLGLAIAATASDVLTVTGSATKTVKVRRIVVSATRTSDAKTDIVLLKRSTANTGGTSTAVTMVPHDSNNAAATAVVRAYTANPTTGTLVGNIRTEKQYIPVASSSSLEELVTWDFGDLASQPITLRGTSEVLAINFNGQTITGPSFNISIQFTEE